MANFADSICKCEILQTVTGEFYMGTYIMPLVATRN